VLVRTWNEDDTHLPSVKKAINNLLVQFGMVPGVDFVVEIAGITDPLRNEAQSDSDIISNPQLKLLRWKLETLVKLTPRAVDADYHQRVLDVIKVANIEITEHDQGLTKITKQRASQLIDSVIELIGEIE
jgi:hypothetical protein